MNRDFFDPEARDREPVTTKTNFLLLLTMMAIVVAVSIVYYLTVTDKRKAEQRRAQASQPFLPRIEAARDSAIYWAATEDTARFNFYLDQARQLLDDSLKSVK
jgi:hypothetical protein